MVSVKTAAPVPKDSMTEVMKALRAIHVNAPIAIGDTLLRDVCGADIVATGNIL
jgi:CxxC motif-containing protein